MDDRLTRRAVFGLFGMSAIVVACGDDKATTSTLAPTLPSSPGTTDAATADATTTTVSPATSASPSTTSTTAALPVDTQAPDATTGPSVVAGINTYVDSNVLTSDSEAYGGSWAGAWAMDDGSVSGTMAGSIVFDVTARMITADLTVDGAMLATPIPPMKVVLPVDSWIYGDDGTFEIGFPTEAGQWKLTSDGGFGKFRLHVDVGNGVAFDATGVASQPSKIPVSFTITGAAAQPATGTIDFTPT